MQPPSNMRLPPIPRALDFGDDAETRLFESRARLTLRCSGGPYNGRVLGSDGEPITIGRRQGCAIRLAVPECSRMHARISFRAGQFWIEDLGTLNGTRVNGKPIEGAVALREGDCIEVGEQTMMVSAGVLLGRQVVRDAIVESGPLALVRPRLSTTPDRGSRLLPLSRPSRSRILAALVGAVLTLGVMVLLRGRLAAGTRPSSPHASVGQAAPQPALSVTGPNVPPAKTTAAPKTVETTFELIAPATLTAPSDGVVRHALARGARVVEGARVVDYHESTEGMQRRLDEINGLLDDDEDNKALTAEAHELGLKLMSPTTVGLRSPLRGLVVDEPPRAGEKIRAGQALARVASVVEVRVPADAVTGDGTRCTLRLVDQGELSVEIEPLGSGNEPLRRFSLVRVPPALRLSAPTRVRVDCGG
jgi:hypothetical protein